MTMRAWLILLLVALLAARGGVSFAMNPGAHGGHLARAAADVHSGISRATAATDCPGHAAPAAADDHGPADATQCPLLSAAALVRLTAAVPTRFQPPRPVSKEVRFASAEQPPRYKPPIS